MGISGSDIAAKRVQLLKELLRGRINSLEAEEVADGCEAGHGGMLAKEVRHPWEMAGVLAGLGFAWFAGVYTLCLSAIALA